MATAAPLMPKATAVWLLDNTALSFDQIAEFCKLHPLEVKAIADGDSAQGIKGLDPVQTGQLTRDQIAEAEKDHSKKLELSAPKVDLPGASEQGKKGPRYTPVSRRQDRPDAIAWFVRNHPEITDAQISKILGTTKATIDQVRNRTHWNSVNIKPVDPVTLGLSTQLELDAVVRKAAEKRAKEDAKRGKTEEGPTLRPASETGALEVEPESEPVEAEAAGEAPEAEGEDEA
jgi:hypothetical protein